MDSTIFWKPEKIDYGAAGDQPFSAGGAIVQSNSAGDGSIDDAHTGNIHATWRLDPRSCYVGDRLVLSGVILGVQGVSEQYGIPMEVTFCGRSPQAPEGFSKVNILTGRTRKEYLATILKAPGGFLERHAWYMSLGGALFSNGSGACGTGERSNGRGDRATIGTMAKAKCSSSSDSSSTNSSSSEDSSSSD